MDMVRDRCCAMLDVLEHCNAVQRGAFHRVRGTVPTGYGTIQCYSVVLEALLDGWAAIMVDRGTITTDRSCVRRGAEPDPARPTPAPTPVPAGGQTAIRRMLAILDGDPVIAGLFAGRVERNDTLLLTFREFGEAVNAMCTVLDRAIVARLHAPGHRSLEDATVQCIAEVRSRLAAASAST